MYIFKNALRCISRSKMRNILIMVIVLVIAVSACIGLSIRQAAENAKEETLGSMEITATISFDRQSAMSNMKAPDDGTQGEGGGFDRGQFAEMMGNSSALTLEEYETYATAQSVKDFYYSADVSVNGSDTLSPVTSEEETENEDNNIQENSMPGMMGGGRDNMMNRVMGAASDFTLTGYSGENAMTDIINGTVTVTQGSIFEEGTLDCNCIISEELATFNSISVGDTITITNPNNEEETYGLTVVGLYTDSSANENSFSMMGMTSNDPANKIYTSYNVLNSIISASAENSTTMTDENTGREFETALSESLSATYTFANVEDYEKFESEARTLGLDDSYIISSADITSFENSLTPLTTLSKTAGYFLAVILIIGAIILIVLNIFNVRERKYEIGVLTAMGMKKGKVALQFLTEIFIVTMIAVIIGAGIGSVTSVPVANALLETQATAQQEQENNIEKNFGRGGNMDKGGNPQGDAPDMPQGGFNNFLSNIPGGESINNYITEIDSATDFTVILYMLLIAVGLTIVAGSASMLFIMRYEPLKILSNRD